MRRVNTQLKIWRVRVLRQIEDWVEVRAMSREAAETAALHLPGVVELRGVTVLGNKRANAAPPPGVEEEDEEA